jgi:peptide deformylase
MAGITCALASLKYFHAKVTALPIVRYPDPILRRIASPVASIDDDILRLTQEMIGILRTRAVFDFFLKGSLCKGMSAPQMGVPKRLMVCGLNGALTILVNPEILVKKGLHENSEYCLSLPEYPSKTVHRSAYVKVRYQNLAAKEKVMVATGQSAGLIEHEIDHLNGVLYIDYG